MSLISDKKLAHELKKLKKEKEERLEEKSEKTRKKKRLAKVVWSKRIQKNKNYKKEQL